MPMSQSGQEETFGPYSRPQTALPTSGFVTAVGGHYEGLSSQIQYIVSCTSACWQSTQTPPNSDNSAQPASPRLVLSGGSCRDTSDAAHLMDAVLSVKTNHGDRAIRCRWRT